MPCSSKLLIYAGCAFLMGAGLRAGAAEKKDKAKAATPVPAKVDKKSDGKKGDGKKSDKPSSTTASDDDKKPSKLVIPLPQGQDSKGVTIPFTDGSGKKTMVFKIGVGTRIDENHIKMSDVVIETYDDAGARELTIALPSSVMDTEKKVITGDESVTIDRSDFQLTGKNMEFNTETRQGWLKGAVKMIIYDLSEKTSSGAPADPKPNPQTQTPKGS